jgi:hypothetical protein
MNQVMKPCLLVVAAAVFAALPGCSDLSQRWELDHARVLAVRLSTPGLAAGDSAAVDVLICDDDGVPSVVAPSLVSFSPTVDPDRAAAVSIVATANGWSVVAASEAMIERARVAAALDPEQPLAVQLAVQVQVGGATATALKTVRLGQRATNPSAVVIAVDGVSQSGDGPQAIDRDVALTLLPAVQAEDLAVDWLTSTGKLSQSETATARLEIAAGDPSSGHVVALLRRDDGGVTWATIAVTVP